MTDARDTIDLDGLERLLADAGLDDMSLHAIGPAVVTPGEIPIARASADADDKRLARAQLIAAAVNALPSLIAEARKAEELREALKLARAIIADAEKDTNMEVSEASLAKIDAALSTGVPS